MDMEIPQEIKNAIRQGAKHYKKGREQNMLVRDWLDSIGQGDNDAIIDQLIDGMENGYDPNGAIENIEKYLYEQRIRP